MSEQGTPEWLAERVGMITCSRFSDVLAYGEHTYADNKANQKLGRAGVTVITELQARKDYKIQIALERLAGKSSQVFETWAMQQGKLREPSAKAIYEYRTGEKIQGVGFVRHPNFAFMGGSPDGLIGEHGGIEIKCPELEQHLENLIAIEKGELPEKYRAQIQGCMCVTVRQWWDFCTFNADFPPHLEFAMLRVEVDTEYCAMLMEKSLEFEIEVRFLVESLNKLNGGPRPAPVRLRDLECSPGYFEYEKCRAHIARVCGGFPIFNNDFDPLSFIYQHSELHEGTGAFHIFKRGDEVHAVQASDEWVKDNTTT